MILFFKNTFRNGDDNVPLGLLLFQTLFRRLLSVVENLPDLENPAGFYLTKKTKIRRDICISTYF